MEYLHEVEHLGDGKEHIRRYRSIEHKEEKSATRNDTRHASTALHDGERGIGDHEVALTTGAVEHADAKKQRLLDDEHQHTRQDEVAITTSRVEHRHLLIFQRHGGDFVFAVCIVARKGHLYLRAHVCCHRHSG